MIAAPADTELCATCGREAAGPHAYCHFYVDGRPRVYCSPDCAEQALLGPDTSPEAGAVSRDYLAELVERVRWEHGA